MNLIQESVQSVLPVKYKKSSSGWISFNAPCCHNRGESKDKRKRGGLLFKGDGVIWHCFNCGYAAGWQPGKIINKNTRDLFKWLGMNDELIGKLIIESMRIKENLPVSFKPEVDLNLKEESLPPNSLLLSEWLNKDPHNPKIVKCLEHIQSRRLSVKDYDWYWSPEIGYEDRLLIPFYQNQKIVGWSGRKLSPGNPKYLSRSQPSYVFNIDSQFNKKFIIVTEGPFDAISIGGVAVLSNEISSGQLTRLNNQGLPIILVPDRDAAGIKLINTALENLWSVSVPPWEDHIKDVSDAIKNYGKVYTLWSILHYCESNQLKIQLMMRKLEKKYNDKN